MGPISVLLVDDSPVFLSFATRFLHAYFYNEVRVIGEAHGGKEALTQAHELKPQVVLLDLVMSDLPGLEVIPCLRAMLPEVGIIVLTVMDNEFYRSAALDAGADDFIPKAAMNTELLPAIRRVVQAQEKPLVGA